MAWNDDGALLAMAIDVDGHTGNGVQLLNARAGAIRSLDAGDESVHRTRVAREGDDLAAMRESRRQRVRRHELYGDRVARRRRRDADSKHAYDFSTDGFVPEAIHARRVVSRAAMVGGRQHHLLRHRAARARRS